MPVEQGLVHVATIAASHGVRGQVKLHSLMESAENLKKYQNFVDAEGQPMALRIIAFSGQKPIAEIAAVHDKNAADQLKGKRIFLPESAFPSAADNEFYAFELVGMQVVDAAGSTIGSVLAHHDFGASDILEIRFKDGREEMFPLNDTVFPEIDRALKRVVFQPPSYV